MAIAQPRAGFWLQHASREADELVTFADDLTQTHAGRPGIVFGPVNVPATLNRLYTRARTAGDAVLGPEGFRLDRAPTKRSEQHFTWLVQSPRPTSRTDWEAWMRESLVHQQSMTPAPSFLMTASPEMDASRGTAELYGVFDAAKDIRDSLPPGTDCWMGVAVERTYLREEPHLTRLGNALVSCGASGIVLRASHQQLPPVDDRRYLEGLKAIVEACAGNGTRVFLPSAGWLGWLAMAWGAWGFSGGMAAGSWATRVPSAITQPDQPTLPYFVSQLRRSLPWRVVAQLTGQGGFQPCQCADCTAMGNAHDLVLAKRHQLRLANDEAAALAPLPVATRRAVVAATLDAAIAFRDGLPMALRDRVSAGFLDRWRDFV